MKRIIFTAGTLAMLAVTGMTRAADPPDADTVTVQIIGQSQYHLSLDEFTDHARSVFVFDNGETLTFRQSNRHYFAELGDQPEVEIFPVAPEVFVSTNGTKYNFEEGIDGIDKVTLTAQGRSLVARQ